MATSIATARMQSARGFADPATVAREQDYVPDMVRVIHGATRWYAVPVCAAFSHRWSSTPWSRWAFGWDREVTCRRCGQMRHERAKLHSDLPYEDDR